MLQQYDQNNHPVMHIAVKKYPAGKAAISASTCASLVGDRVDRILATLLAVALRKRIVVGYSSVAGRAKGS